MNKIVKRKIKANVRGTEIKFLEKVMINIETKEEIFDE